MQEFNHALLPVAAGMLAGVVGTGLGGAFSFLVPTPSQRFLSFAYGVSAGLMLSIVCFDMLPEAFAFTSVYVVCAFVAVGAVCVMFFDCWLQRRQPVKATGNSRLLSMAVLLIFTVAAHNFPEGLAIGSTMAVDSSLGLGIAAVIALHNIPEGVVIAASMSGRGVSALKIAAYAACAGIPMGVGSFVGLIAGDMSPAVIGVCLALAAGAMVIICTSELIPSSHNLYNKNFSGFSVTFGFVFGIILSTIL